MKNGHRLGFWCAVPAALVGLLAGHRAGVFRYLGYTDNGNPTLYPNYKEDQTRAWLRGALLLAPPPAPHPRSSLFFLPCAAYFVKHVVSDRHANVAPSLHLDDPTRFR